MRKIFFSIQNFRNRSLITAIFVLSPPQLKHLSIHALTGRRFDFWRFNIREREERRRRRMSRRFNIYQFSWNHGIFFATLSISFHRGLLLPFSFLFLSSLHPLSPVRTRNTQKLLEAYLFFTLIWLEFWFFRRFFFFFGQVLALVIWGSMDVCCYFLCWRT